jgi:hypothetical protein
VACATVTHNAGRALVLPPRCGAYQDVRDFDAARTLSLDVAATGSGWARGFLAGWSTDTVVAPDYRARNATRVVHAGGPDDATGWRTLTTGAPLATNGLGVVRVVLVNDTPAAVSFDDVRLVAGGPNPPDRVGTLLHAVHRSAWSVRAGAAPATLSVPLPMDAAGQVPLLVDLVVDPPALATVAIGVDPLGNRAATITFPAATAADHVEVDWDAVVLTRELSPAERPDAYAADTAAEPTRWLAASPIADAALPALARVGAALRAADPEGTLAAVVRWTSTNVRGLGKGPVLFLPGLDATSVFRGARTSCTGFANTAAALGRAAGLPTRIVAGILTGAAQQTHFVDESWLGADLGWRRFEPQGRSSVPEDYLVLLRRVVPDDEGTAARRGRRFAAAGVPLHTLTEPAGATRRLGWAAPTRPLDCPDCDNDARVSAPLFGDADRLRALFARARTRWRATGDAPPAEPALQGVLALRSLDDLEAWLATPR